MLLSLWVQPGGALEVSGNTAALRKAAAGVCCKLAPTRNQQVLPRRCSREARLPYAPAQKIKQEPRGRSRCTSPHGAPRNKSRGRADRTLVLGCCGAAAQNAGSRPGLPLIAPDTRRFPPTPHGRKTRPPPREKKNFENIPQGRKNERTSRRGLDAQRWARETNQMQTFTRAEGSSFETSPERGVTTRHNASRTGIDDGHARRDGPVGHALGIHGG